MTEKQIELGRHALGLPNRTKESYRNHFCAGTDHSDYPEWMAMVDQGDAMRSKSMASMGGDYVFWLTMEGARKCLKPKEQLDEETKWPRGSSWEVAE